MIRSTAPTRIDLAGGTLDIWPLYLFFNAPTLNAAIDLYATVEIVARKDKKIILESEDLGLKQTFSSLASFPDRHPLQLILRTLRHYQPQRGLRLTSRCAAPAGSGIGGSSALSIALHGALSAFTGRRTSRETMIRLSRNIETQVISVPAGWQDYFPAAHGGALAVHPTVTGVDFKRMPIAPEEMTGRFVLCYTGKPRNSGINNWDVTKKTIDGNKTVRRHLAKIQSVARDMEKVFFAGGGLDRIAPLFAAEWQARKALAPGISTPHMDRLFATAKKHGALAGKVCGAGGGGCMAFIVRRGAKSEVEKALQKQGGTVLGVRFVSRGLRVRTL